MVEGLVVGSAGAHHHVMTQEISTRRPRSDSPIFLGVPFRFDKCQ